MPNLSTYLDPLLSEDGGCQPKSISTASLPDLRHDIPNTILMYYGSFNPPHIHHLAMLRILSAFTSDWNVVGIVIWCLPDRHLGKKSRKMAEELETTPPLRLSHSQRARLWLSEPCLTPHTWVIEEDMLAFDDDPGLLFGWVAEAASYDGFSVRWVDVLGSDRFLNRFHENAPRPIEDRDVVVCDIGRLSDDLYDGNSGNPKQLPGFPAWRELDGKAVLTGIAQHADMPGTSVWECARRDPRGCQIRFVCTRYWAARETAGRELSSSLIRAMIQREDLEEEMEWEGLVLSPGLLKTFLAIEKRACRKIDSDAGR